MDIHKSNGDVAYAGRLAAGGGAARDVGIALLAFLTVVDLFAAQAILPTLQMRYDTTPAVMGLAVNASTLGMAAAGLLVALFSRSIDKRRGTIVSLLLLAGPTAALAHAPNVTTFAILRILQGLCMASAFSLTLAHLGEASMSPREAATAFAAYVTGNVASNLVGRIFSSGLADMLGLSANFYAFSALNVAGAVLAAVTMSSGQDRAGAASDPRDAVGILPLLARPSLRAACMIGACILFAFIGVFTYINFVLVRPPFSIGPMSLGLVYLVFLPSIVTTPMAGWAAARFGARRTLRIGLIGAAAGLPLVLSQHLPLVLAGLAIVAAGTFCAQAVATGFATRAGSDNRSAASGLYLASYFGGGLIGTIVLGKLFDGFGWAPCVAAIAVVVMIGLTLSRSLPDD
jgi:predicted MFS family arabinose efflux permease